jgi:hypothetical protein
VLAGGKTSRNLEKVVGFARFDPSGPNALNAESRIDSGLIVISVQLDRYGAAH